MNDNAAKISELTDLLRESIVMCREDRKLAKNNHESLRKQLDNILDTGVEGSEEGKIEAEVNKSLKLVFDSGSRMESVIAAITKVLIAEMANTSRETIASNIFGGGNFNPRQIVKGPIDIKQLMNDEFPED